MEITGENPLGEDDEGMWLGNGDDCFGGGYLGGPYSGFLWDNGTRKYK